MSEWTEHLGTDLTAAFQGFSIPLRHLLDEIHGRGWDVANIDFRKDAYVAKGKNPHGESIERSGPTEETAAANLLMAIMRRETMRYAAWKNNWITELQTVARAYAEADVFDPKAAGAWRELAEDSLRRAEIIGQQIQIETTPDPAPYDTIDDMIEDVKQKRHILITTANTAHPLWSTDQVLAYRTAHDVLGHCISGGDWGWHGENLATAAHMPMLSPEAQKALFTEAIGQTAFNTFYQSFGPQKIAFLEEELENVRKEEQNAGHSGTHPSQTVVPANIPIFEISNESPEIRRSRTAATDPNHQWSSEVPPLLDNAYLWQRDQNGLDPLDAQGLREQAAYLDSDWHGTTHPDGTPDLDTRKQAVVNAFRAVLLGGRKPFRQNATHYQHIRHIPAGVEDPMRYWAALEAQREAHNQGRGLPPAMHQAPFASELEQFKGWIRSLEPNLSDPEVLQKAQSELFHMLAEEEQRIENHDDKNILTAQEIEREAAKAMQKRLSVATKPRIDEKHDFGKQQLFAAADGGYGSYLAHHLRPVAATSHHGDKLLAAAHEDMANGGTGHLFRSRVLDTKIPGVGPKEASYAWMLLAPRTSQLAVVSDQLGQALGYKPEDLNDRDYFKHERELAAGRDASGYGHIPLGQFGWGLHDQVTHGPGFHRDHTPLRVLDPNPVEHYNWDTEPPVSGKWNEPYWWKSTQEARDQVARDWDHRVAPKTPSHEIPKFAGLEDPYPWIHSDEYGDEVGAPGESLMKFLKMHTQGLTTEQIWSLKGQAGRDGFKRTKLDGPNPTDGVSGARPVGAH